MTVTLPSDVQKMVEEQLAAGAYSTVEDVLRAGVVALSAQTSFGDFAPGELDALIAEGEERLRQHGSIPADEVFDRIREKSMKAREQTRNPG